MSAGDSVMRRARFLVIEALYESETSDHIAEEAFNRRVRDIADEDPELAGDGPSGFGRGILRGILRRRPELDQYIQEAATQYPVETLAIVDRNILRLAIWELLSDNSAPVAAVVNEAVELAHRYGGESSPAFVNGVLRTISQRIRTQPEQTQSVQNESVQNQSVQNESVPNQSVQVPPSVADLPTTPQE